MGLLFFAKRSPCKSHLFMFFLVKKTIFKKKKGKYDGVAFFPMAAFYNTVKIGVLSAFFLLEFHKVKCAISPLR